jgi:trk system potassium uptake protein
MINFKKNPYLVVLLSFLGVILIGSFLLSTPLASTNQTWGKFIDHLFMATSALAVTGLSVFSDVGHQYSTFGEIILMILMLLGGLGIITIFTFFTIIFGRKIGIMDRYLLKEALNLTSMQGAIRLIQNIVLIAFIFILIGAFSLSWAFVPEMGWGEGMYQALFLSVSAFNNAGLDTLGDSSLMAFSRNPIVLSTTMFLIVSGGLGFLVWLEIFAVIKAKWNAKKQVEETFGDRHRLSTYSQIVLTMTGILIPLGMVLLLLTELNVHPDFLWSDALFTSVSSRTAGLTVVSIRDLTNASKYLLIALMFIGANPISTGGGVKTTTTFIVVLAIVALLRGKRVHAYKRTFSIESILKSMALIIISVFFLIIMILTVEYIEQFNSSYPEGTLTATSILFEVVSAFGTVGFSEGITPYLSDTSKVILSVIMLLGRIGPIAAISVFTEKLSWSKESTLQYVEVTIPIG